MILKNNKINSHIYNPIWAELFLDAPFQSFQKGNVIFENGDCVDKVCLITSGKVNLNILTANGEVKILYYLNSGGLIGDVCAISNTASYATIICVTDVTLKWLSPGDFIEKIRAQSLLTQLISVYAEFFRYLIDHISDLTFMNIDKMICKYLFRMSQNYGIETANGIMINNKITQQQISDMLGCSRITVAKTVSELTKNGIISKSKGHFYILDKDKIKNYFI